MEHFAKLVLGSVSCASFLLGVVVTIVVVWIAS